MAGNWKQVSSAYGLRLAQEVQPNVGIPVKLASAATYQVIKISRHDRVTSHPVQSAPM
ncbi:hypothetical protein HDG38_000196 [Paraburkholderia sp. WSM4177]|nr:hypothetical protein [Paraburkholderia sp. WSM4177]MBB5482002.1 hypothetical protein [Paraburkholderia sp. WSM4180]